ncbi:MAG: hypothetical protein ACREQ3_13430 [Candidatus Binatia bacterium]
MRKIDQFEAQADNGQVFTIYEYQQDISTGHYRDQYPPVPRVKEFHTSQGLQVNNKGDGTYLIVELRLEVHRMSKP